MRRKHITTVHHQGSCIPSLRRSARSAFAWICGLCFSPFYKPPRLAYTCIRRLNTLHSLVQACPDCHDHHAQTSHQVPKPPVMGQTRKLPLLFHLASQKLV